MFHTTGLNCVVYLVNAQINAIKITARRTCVLIATLLILAIITPVQRNAKRTIKSVHSPAIVVSDTAVVLKRDVKLQPTNQPSPANCKR